jgi:hypothetical protein
MSRPALRHRKPIRHCRWSRAGDRIARLTTTHPPPAKPATSWPDTHSIRVATSVAYRTNPARPVGLSQPASSNRAAPLKSP